MRDRCGDLLSGINNKCELIRFSAYKTISHHHEPDLRNVPLLFSYTKTLPKSTYFFLLNNVAVVGIATICLLLDYNPLATAASEYNANGVSDAFW